jgi:proline iminopeptidase
MSNHPLIGESEGTIPVAGTSLYYLTLGEGRSVIMIHGGPGLGHYYLRPGMDRLAEKFRVIYYDQRGSGRSEVGDTGRMNPAGAVDDLDAVREFFGIEKANIFGHSFGANIGLLYAALHPDRIRSLVLASPGPPLDREQQAALYTEMSRRMTDAQTHRIEQIQASEPFRMRDPKAVEDYIRVQYRPFFRSQDWADSIVYAFTQVSADTVIGGEEAMMAEFEAFKLEEGLADLTAPTLVLRGGLEPIPEAFPRFMAEIIPGARYQEIRGVNHFAYAEDPDPFFASVTSFLAEHAK